VARGGRRRRGDQADRDGESGAGGDRSARALEVEHGSAPIFVRRTSASSRRTSGARRRVVDDGVVPGDGRASLPGSSRITRAQCARRDRCAPGEWDDSPDRIGSATSR